jgi:hypothetical protein
MTTTIKFLKNWTIDLEKLPAYVEFNQEFKEDIDFTLAKIISETDDKRITNEIKTDFKKIVERINGNI